MPVAFAVNSFCGPAVCCLDCCGEKFPKVRSGACLESGAAFCCSDGKLGSHRSPISQAGWPTGDQSLSTLLGFPAACTRAYRGLPAGFEELKPEDVALLQLRASLKSSWSSQPGREGTEISVHSESPK